MGWNYLSIPKLQHCNRWGLGMDKLFHRTLYDGCNYLSMLGLKLIHVSKRGPWSFQVGLITYPCPWTKTGLPLLVSKRRCREISNIRRTKSQTVNDSHLVLKSSFANPLKPSVKSKMKMLLEQRRQAMLQLHLSDRQFNYLLRCVLY